MPVLRPGIAPLGGFLALALAGLAIACASRNELRGAHIFLSSDTLGPRWADSGSRLQSAPFADPEVDPFLCRDRPLSAGVGSWAP